MKCVRWQCMGSGPSLMYATEVPRAFEKFKVELKLIVQSQTYT